MPFDPSKPADHSPLVSAEMRGQLNALSQAVADALNTANANAVAAIAGTSNNSNTVGTLGQGASGIYDAMQMQVVLDKLDELISALRR